MEKDYSTPPATLHQSYLSNPSRYSKMQFNRCGKSGLKLPAVSLGTWQNFGAVDDFENGRKMILRAFDLGVTHFDYGNNYGRPPGSAEENFSKILKQDLASHRDELIVATKAGYDMWPGPYGEWGSRKYLIASLDQSLRRLGVDYVDIFYSHRFDPETPLEETMNALDHMVRSGKALYVGISSYSPKKTSEASSILKSLGTPCLVHQSSYSMLNRWVEDELLDVLETEGIGFMAFSPLAQGLLSEKYLSGIPTGTRGDMQRSSFPHRTIPPEIATCLQGLSAIADNRGQSLTQMALAWALRDSRVASVVIGAHSVTQIEENIKALDNISFSTEELDAIDRFATNHELIDRWINSRTSG